MEIYNEKDYEPFEESEKGKTVLWTYPSDGALGIWLFSFDGTHLFNFWADYPDNLSKSQKEIFDKENPYRASLKS